MMRTIEDMSRRGLLGSGEENIFEGGSRRPIGRGPLGRGPLGRGSVGSMMGMSALLLALGACGGSSSNIKTDPDPKTDPTLSFTGADATKSLEEGNLDAGTYVATLKGSTGSVTYSVSGADAALFEIDANTGVLSFRAAPDYEALTLSEQTDGLSVTITASSGSLTAEHTVRVSVTDVDLKFDAESLMGGSLASVALITDENVDFKHDFKVTGGEGVKFSLGGEDAGLFSVDEDTGEVSFAGSFDYEDATDEGKDNGYTFSIVATHKSGETVEVKRVTVRVEDVNDAPKFGADEESTWQVLEGETVAGTYVASDEDAGDSVKHSIKETDSLFVIDETTGALSFKDAPIYDDDEGASNVYDVTIVATDNDGLTAEHSLKVEVVKDTGAIVFLNVDSEESVQENTQAVGTFAVSGASAAVTYTLDGADAALFEIDGDGKLSFKAAPDFETPPVGGDNEYDVTITATTGAGDDEKTASHVLTVTVTDANDAPLWDSETGTVSVAENETAVAYVAMASDEDVGDRLTYSVGGADGDKFSIDATTGALSFKSGADFEAKGSVAGSNDYSVTVVASDGKGGTDTHELTVSVTDVDEAPKFAEGLKSTWQVLEGETVAGTYAASDEDGDNVTYSLGGTDAGLFTIDETTGALTFTDAGGVVEGTSYEVTIVAKSTGTSSTEQTAEHVLVVEVVDNANGIAFLNVDSEKGVEENSTAVGTFVAKAVGGAAVTYSVTGADAALFAIDASTGELTFTTAPDYEATKDLGANNEYDVTVVATSGGNSVEHELKVTVSDVNEAPIFDEGLVSNVEVVENGVSVVGTFTAMDVEGESVEYTIKEGGDGAFFTIDGNGRLSFLRVPDFESLTADQKANGFSVTIEASDSGGLTAEHNLVVKVTDVNEAPVFVNPVSEVSVAENTQAVVTFMVSDEDVGDTLMYGVKAEGEDATFFTIDGASGALSFANVPNYETLTDAQKADGFSVTVVVSDGGGFTAEHTLVVRVSDEDEGPVFETITEVWQVLAGKTAVGTIVASDEDGDSVKHSIKEGEDGALFDIDETTGALSFKDASTGNGGDNTYDVTITATSTGASGSEQTATHSVKVEVVPETDQVIFLNVVSEKGVEENSTEVGIFAAIAPNGAGVAYVLSGTDAGLFEIDGEGKLSFKVAPDFETPTDASDPKDGVYDVTVTATSTSDVSLTASHALKVSVTNVNEAPTFDGADAEVTVAENSQAVALFTASDVDAGDTLRYSIKETDSLFTINGGGVLSFIDAPDFEDLTAGQKANGFSVTIVATDGGGFKAEHELVVKVTDVNDAPLWDSETGIVNVAENETAVAYTAMATDADAGDMLTYSVSGDESGLFSIDANSGVLSFMDAPDYENALDAGRDNGYEVTITADDGEGGTATHELMVNVLNVNEAPVFAAGLATEVTFAENTGTDVTLFTARASDVDDGDRVTYNLGGTDRGKFDINQSTGVLSFKPGASNFEVLTLDQRADGLSVTITANDGRGGTATHDLVVFVTNVEEAPVFINPVSEVSVAENTQGVATFTAGDVEGGAVTFSVKAGGDGHLFTIDPTSGVLIFKDDAVPNFEDAKDAGGNNEYAVTITASDVGGLTAEHTLVVKVTNVEEGPLVFEVGTPAGVSVKENSQAVATFTASDPDGGAVTYSVSGTVFTIDVDTGELSFIDAPDYEVLTAGGGSAALSVTITATLGAQTATHDLTVTVTDVIETGPLAFDKGSSSTLSLDENIAEVGTFSVKGIGSGSAVFTLSGHDEPLFMISDAGALSFNSIAVPDFEMPVGFDNEFEVTITATTGTGADAKTAIHVFMVTITDVNEAPVWSPVETETVSVAENTLAVAYMATASDEDVGDTLMYSLSGAEGYQFMIDGNGVLTFTDAPDFEGPLGVDNDFEVTITATDGDGLTATHNLVVRVTDANDDPRWFSDVATVKEGETAVIYDMADDQDPGDTLTYRIKGGVDAGFFDIVEATGALSFKSAPDYEALTDDQKTNGFSVTVTVSDGGGGESDLALMVTVTNVEEGPLAFEGTPPASVSVKENSQEVVATFTASDPDGGAVTYSVSGTVFTIDANTGELTFTTPPDYEALTAGGGSAALSVTITATLDAQTVNHVLTVTVTDVDESGPLAFVGGASSTLSLDENIAEVGIFSVKGIGSESAVFTLGGTDAGLFAIDVDTGALSFIDAPDYEALTLSERTNGLSVTITATTGTGADAKTVSHVLTLTVTDVNEVPVFDAGLDGEVTFAENTGTGVTLFTAMASDEDAGDSVMYTLANFAQVFDINENTGDLTFKNVLDYEALSQFQKDNGLSVTIEATDGGGLTATHNLVVKVTNVNEAPIFDGANAEVSVAENTGKGVTLFTARASDVDDGDSVTYSVSGTDAGFFAIDGDGKLSFKEASDFESLTAAQKTNGLSVTVVASDDGGLMDTHNLVVRVTDVNEAPVFSSLPGEVGVREGVQTVGTYTATDEDAGDSVTYRVTGDDAGLFNIDAATGELTFKTPPVYASLTAAQKANGFSVTIEASDDDGLKDTHDLVVTVHDPGLLSFSDKTSPTAAIKENTTAVTEDNSFEIFGAVGTVMYSLSGVDAGFFDIDATTGALSFKNAPDFETKLDDGTDNVYDVTIEAMDDTSTASHDLSVEVENATYGIRISGPGIIPSAQANYYSLDNHKADENQTLALSFTLEQTGGAKFTSGFTFFVDERFYRDYQFNDMIKEITDAEGMTTYELHYQEPQDFEGVASRDKVLDLKIVVSGSDSYTTTFLVEVNLQDVNDAPRFTSSDSLSVAEGTTAVGTVTADDDDSRDGAVTFSLGAGGDSGVFMINTTTGELTFNEVPDFETKNEYTVTVIGTSGTGDKLLTTSHEIMVTVTDEDEAPMFAEGLLGTAKVFGGKAEVGTYIATDEDADDDVTYSIKETVSSFTIDANGILSFKNAPAFDMTTPANNAYEVTIVATSGDAGSEKTDEHLLMVEVVNDSLIFQNAVASVNVDENTEIAQEVGTFAAISPTGGTVVTYGLSGADAGDFMISVAGVLTFNSVPDHEMPSDADLDNIYDVTITASTGAGANEMAEHMLAVTVINLDDNPAMFVAIPNPDPVMNVDENTTLVGSYEVSDADGGTVTYSLEQTGDHLLFAIDNTGMLSFRDDVYDFETPTMGVDGVDNQYKVAIQASSGGTTLSHALTVNVVNVNENPVWSEDAETVSVDENTTAAVVYTATASDVDAGDMQMYSVTGADAGLFMIDETSGELTFTTPPDYEALAPDKNTNGFSVTVVVTDDGNLTDTLDLMVKVKNLNEAPMFADNLDTTVAMTAGIKAVGTFMAVDEDDGDNVTYMLTGTDAALFDLNATTGALSFIKAPAYDAKVGGDNEYDVTIVATGGTAGRELTTEHELMVNVETLTMLEFTMTTTTYTSREGTSPESFDFDVNIDDDGDEVMYRLEGVDKDVFRITTNTDGSNGVLQFRDIEPDFELIGHGDGADATYNVTVVATYGGLIVKQDVVAMLTNLTDNPDNKDDVTVKNYGKTGSDSDISDVITVDLGSTGWDPIAFDDAANYVKLVVGSKSYTGNSAVDHYFIEGNALYIYTKPGILNAAESEVAITLKGNLFWKGGSRANASLSGTNTVDIGALTDAYDLPELLPGANGYSFIESVHTSDYGEKYKAIEGIDLHFNTSLRYYSGFYLKGDYQIKGGAAGATFKEPYDWDPNPTSQSEVIGNVLRLDFGGRVEPHYADANGNPQHTEARIRFTFVTDVVKNGKGGNKAFTTDWINLPEFDNSKSEQDESDLGLSVGDRDDDDSSDLVGVSTFDDYSF